MITIAVFFFTEFDLIRMVKQTPSSSLDSDLPDISSLNVLDEESAYKNKAHTPVSQKRKVSTQFLNKRITTMPTERNTVRMEREGTPLGFPDSVYVHAAAIFQKTRMEKNLAHRLTRYGRISPSGHEEDHDDDDEDDNDNSRIVDKAKTKQNELWAYELAFNALKCK